MAGLKIMSIRDDFENAQLEALNKNVPDFVAGDTLRVNVRIVEGDKERIQAFEGVCIARKNRGIHSSFTVRKISHGEGVERVFPLFSPRIESVVVVRRGVVRRAKLYYMRELSGKAARIRERKDLFPSSSDGAEVNIQSQRDAALSEEAAQTSETAENQNATPAKKNGTRG